MQPTFSNFSCLIEVLNCDEVVFGKEDSDAIGTNFSLLDSSLTLGLTSSFAFVVVALGGSGG